MTDLVPISVGRDAAVRRMLRAVAQVIGVDLTDVHVQGLCEALSDVSLDHLRLGLQRAMRQHHYRTFPLPADIRRAVDGALEDQHRIDELQGTRHVAREEPWHFACESCEDTGWLSRFEKPAIYGGDVEVRRVRPCPCRATNHTWQRKHGLDKSKKYHKEERR